MRCITNPSSSDDTFKVAFGSGVRHKYVVMYCYGTRNLSSVCISCYLLNRALTCTRSDLVATDPTTGSLFSNQGTTVTRISRLGSSSLGSSRVCGCSCGRDCSRNRRHHFFWKDVGKWNTSRRGNSEVDAPTSQVIGQQLHESFLSRYPDSGKQTEVERDITWIKKYRFWRVGFCPHGGRLLGLQGAEYAAGLSDLSTGGGESSDRS